MTRQIDNEGHGTSYWKDQTLEVKVGERILGACRTNDLTPLEAALEYVRAGFAVYPGKPDKTPMHGWGPLQATTDAKAIREAWEKYPDALIMAPMGRGIIAIDLDHYGRRDVAERFADLEDKFGQIPVTVTTVTGGGGVHYFFRTSALDLRGGPAKLGKGIDVLADGQVVILPPSRSVKGPYKAMHGDLLDGEMIAELPREWELAIRNGVDGRVKGQVRRASQDLKPAADPVNVSFIEHAAEHGLFPLKWDGPVDAGVLRAFCSVEAVVRRMVAHLGIRRMERFHCVLHREKNPSASISRGGNGVFVYNDHHGRSKQTLDGVAGPKRVYLLGEVYRAVRTGSEAPMADAQVALWTILLLIDAGVLQPAPVRLAQLPTGVPDCAQKAWQGAQRLFESRWLYAPGKPAPYTRRFAAYWCRLSEHHAGKGIDWLIKNGYLLVASGSAGRSSTRLLSPGDGRGLTVPGPVPLAACNLVAELSSLDVEEQSEESELELPFPSHQEAPIVADFAESSQSRPGPLVEFLQRWDPISHDRGEPLVDLQGLKNFLQTSSGSLVVDLAKPSRACLGSLFEPICWSEPLSSEQGGLLALRHFLGHLRHTLARSSAIGRDLAAVLRDPDKGPRKPKRKRRIKPVDVAALRCKELLTYEDAASMLSVSKRTVERLVSSGDLRTVKQGRRRMIRATELKRYVCRLEIASRVG